MNKKPIRLIYKSHEVTDAYLTRHCHSVFVEFDVLNLENKKVESQKKITITISELWIRGKGEEFSRTLSDDLFSKALGVVYSKIQGRYFSNIEKVEEEMNVSAMDDDGLKISSLLECEVDLYLGEE